jgi:hypothetical protein
MIWSHFGSGKSSGFTIPLVAWLLGKNPNTRIKLVANLDNAAAQRVQAVKALMMTKRYQLIFPDFKPGVKWTDHELFVKRQSNSIDPSLHARGVNVQGIGGRADYLVFDDCCDMQNSITEQQRQNIKTAFLKVWQTRLPFGRGQMLWIGTPWHSGDMSHALLQTPGWGSLIQRVRGPELGCEAIDAEVHLNPRAGEILPPYPHGPMWQPGQPWASSQSPWDGITLVKP